MNRVTRSIEELAADGFGALAAAGDDGVVLVRKRGGVVLPLGAIVRGLERALQGGMGPEDAADLVADVIDASFDFTELVSGPVGVAIEAADRPIVRFVAGLLADRIARRIAQDDGASG